MKRPIALIALAMAIVLVGAGTWVLLPGKGADLPPGGDQPGGDGPGGDGPAGTNDTYIAPVFHPVDIEPSEAKLSVALSFPGQGEAGTEYLVGEAYDFVIRTTGDGWKGRAVLKVFAERTPEIGHKCLILTYSENVTQMALNLSQTHGSNHLSGNAVVWAANGTDDRTDRLSVVFNRTGAFELTFQVFDAATGAPLSVPTRSGTLEVPEQGELVFRALNRGEWRTVDNTTYLAILLNVTNGWNVRYTVDAAYLVLYHGDEAIAVSSNVTAFDAQSLAPGQSTQFLAFFLVDDRNDLELEYAEPGRPPIPILLE